MEIKQDVHQICVKTHENNCTKIICVGLLLHACMLELKYYDTSIIHCT